MEDNFSVQQKEVLKLLKLLSDNGVLDHVVLIGSWAEYVYAQAGVLPGFTMSLRTIDIDFLIKNLRRPANPVSIPVILKQHGYHVTHDALHNTTKLIGENGLEIEFLIPQKGSGTEFILKTNLGVNAQALRHLGSVTENSVVAELFGIKVSVPCPEIYILTKMVINKERSAAKQLKDLGSIIGLLPFIDFSRFTSLYATTTTKKEKANVRWFIDRYRDELNTLDTPEVKSNLAEFISNVFEGT